MSSETVKPEDLSPQEFSVEIVLRLPPELQRMIKEAEDAGALSGLYHVAMYGTDEELERALTDAYKETEYDATFNDASYPEITYPEITYNESR